MLPKKYQAAHDARLSNLPMTSFDDWHTPPVIRREWRAREWRDGWDDEEEGEEGGGHAEDAEEVEAYYRLLCGAPIPGEGTALLSVASLRRAARELRFDLDERQAHLMISQFDRGRGALSLDDFRRVVRVAGRMLEIDANKHCVLNHFIDIGLS